MNRFTSLESKIFTRSSANDRRAPAPILVGYTRSNPAAGPAASGAYRDRLRVPATGPARARGWPQSRSWGRRWRWSAPDAAARAARRPWPGFGESGGWPGSEAAPEGWTLCSGAPLRRNSWTGGRSRRAAGTRTRSAKFLAPPLAVEAALRDGLRPNRSHPYSGPVSGRRASRSSERRRRRRRCCSTGRTGSGSRRGAGSR